MSMTPAEVETWLRGKTSGRSRTSPEETVTRTREPDRVFPEETLDADSILVSSEIKNRKLRKTTFYSIPKLSGWISTRVPALTTGMSDAAKRDAIKATMPNRILGALLNQLVP